MPFSSFGEYISNSEDENYPTWPCLNKKDDGSICGKRYCIRHYKSLSNKICTSCNKPILLARESQKEVNPEGSVMICIFGRRRSHYKNLAKAKEF